jgi:(E)-4-hydroxy-3-methylbut-2-enyl-diphosphate synthase
MKRKTKQVMVGNVPVGGGAPVSVQSMTSTDTADYKETISQVKRLEEAGCEIIRLAFPNRKALSSLEKIVEVCRVPVVADIHFSCDLALMALDAGVHKIRVNPGNLGGLHKMDEILKVASNKGAAIRIGINSGSLEDELLEKYGHPSADALVESALRSVEYCESKGFKNLVVSLKSSNVRTCLDAYRGFSSQSDYPLHVGVTEAGSGNYAIIKSSAGIGSLLLDGIGDTIRVSITGDPVIEVHTAFDLLKATGVRINSPELISCPTCGRIQIDLEGLICKVQKVLDSVTEPIKVTVLGCPVNGPGDTHNFLQTSPSLLKNYKRVEI